MAVATALCGDISEQQANDLIKLIGTDWNWPLREARFLTERN
ncbi:hypothetical protein [Mesorhizobium huakuii]|nr:hypothetical protein [Mesorhizobium huakuii]